MTISDPSHAMNQKRMLGHPIGLYILFFTELWERFSYYGMRAILVLFIVDNVASGGLGWTNAAALSLYGTYTMSVYLASIPGGILADRLLGQKKTVMLGGILLCIGHLILAIPTLWAFYAGLGFIVAGVGGLKANISTMVGGLYKQGDPDRDRGFTVFYIGINIGAFLAGIIVASVAKIYGWHYGFGLAGLGMIVGQIVFVYGQKYLVGVGDYIKAELASDGKHEKPLTKIEKERIFVLLISFLIVIVFWGSFEQAGGLMNLYAQQKTDRFIDLFNFEIPAGWFQSVNSFFIITLGTAIASFWVLMRIREKEDSSIFKMALGTIIMAFGFLFMVFASLEAGAVPFGKAGMIWLILAYLFHTIGELCLSPVSLSFITKLAPVKYASIMMGIYFAATGLGNKVAGIIGEASQSEPVEVAFNSNSNLPTYVLDSIKNESPVVFQTVLTPNSTNFELLDYETKAPISQYFNISEEERVEIIKVLTENNVTSESPFHALISMDIPSDLSENLTKEDYKGSLVIDEIQNEREYNTFLAIMIFATLFGAILILFLRPLKKLTHGAEAMHPEDESEHRAVDEGYSRRDEVVV